jgi:hemolysin-activating ACP:hemolysin acyltransferase
MNGRDKTSGKGGADRPEAKGAPDPDVVAKIASMRTRVLSAIGRVTVAMAALPRYRHQTLADLSHLVLEPLVRDRIAIATPKPASQAEPDIGALAGIAIWASVSQEVDAKIREQIKAGVFPLRLKADDWTSGNTVWLLDVIAPTRQLATAVLAHFRQLAGDRKVFIHPMIARLVDPKLLKQLGAEPSPGSSQTIN